MKTYTRTHAHASTRTKREIERAQSSGHQTSRQGVEGSKSFSGTAVSSWERVICLQKMGRCELWHQETQVSKPLFYLCKHTLYLLFKFGSSYFKENDYYQNNTGWLNNQSFITLAKGPLWTSGLDRSHCFWPNDTRPSLLQTEKLTRCWNDVIRETLAHAHIYVHAHTHPYWQDAREINTCSYWKQW